MGRNCSVNLAKPFSAFVQERLFTSKEIED